MRISWNLGPATDVTGIAIALWGRSAAVGYGKSLRTKTFAYLGLLATDEHQWTFMIRVWRFQAQLTRRTDVKSYLRVNYRGNRIVGKLQTAMSAGRKV